MPILKHYNLIAISLLLAIGLSGCNKPGPAETAGKKLDQTVDDAGKKISESTDRSSAKLSDQGDKASAVIDDAEITTKVKAAIFEEPGLKTLQISVDTVKGVVTLSGSVDSKQSSDKASSLASAVSGVKNVDNKLVQK
jgi:hyperosmotically inducible protein